MGKSRKLLGTPIGLPAMLLGGPGVALTVPGLRTASYIAGSIWDGLLQRVSDDRQRRSPSLSAKLAAKVAADEAARTLMLGMAHFPSRSQRVRIREELSSALVVWEENGWLSDARAFHRTPPPLTRPRIERRQRLPQRARAPRHLRHRRPQPHRKKFRLHKAGADVGDALAGEGRRLRGLAPESQAG